MRKILLLIGCISLLAFVVYYSMARRSGSMMGGKRRQMMEPPQGENQKSQNETVGSKIFTDDCASCHPNGENIMSPSPPLKGSHMLANFEAFLLFIRNPSMPDGSQGSMPSFASSKISDNQARELYHFVTSM